MKAIPISITLVCTLLVSNAATLKENTDVAGRIVGGQVTPIESLPYQVALYRYNTYISVCGGTIISEYAVLTAAHCVQGLFVDDLIFSAGSNFNNRSGSIHRADWIVVHYDYDWTTLSNDIAFVKVVEPFVFSNQVKPATLPTAATPAAASAIVSGWGPLYVRGAELQSASVPVVSLATCQSKYSNFELHPSQDTICAGPATGTTGPCDGDAGGPLVVQDTLVGVFAWGAACGDPQYPAVFANVYYFKQFIDENLSYIKP